MAEIISLSPPWIGYTSMLEELFGYDPEITIVNNPSSEAPEVTLLVNNQVKADAIAKLLPIEKNFGGVVLKIFVKPANSEETPADVLRKAFQGNPVLHDVVTFPNPQGVPMTYVEFVKDVVQYWDDRLDDPNGYHSTLYEDIAREVFEDVDVCFTTELGQ